MHKQLPILFPANIETLQEGEVFALYNRDKHFKVREHFYDGNQETKAVNITDCTKLILIPHGTICLPVNNV